MKPVVKWVGGKTQLLDRIVPLIPEFDTYYEPFFGGGSVFFSVKPKKSHINDINGQLINLYVQIKNNFNDFTLLCDEISNVYNTLDTIEEKDKYYYFIRSKYNECLELNELSLRSASYFLFLNKSCFNGVYRLNSKGFFNVPSSHKEIVNLYERINLLEVAVVLKKTELTAIDFEKVCSNCKENDFVFFDSPYYNTFDTYQSGGFNLDDHIRLNKLFIDLTNKGVKCLLTNSNEDYIKNLYKDFIITETDVKRNINSDGSNRKGKEVIIRNYEI